MWPVIGLSIVSVAPKTYDILKKHEKRYFKLIFFTFLINFICSYLHLFLENWREQRSYQQLSSILHYDMLKGFMSKFAV